MEKIGIIATLCCCATHSPKHFMCIKSYYPQANPNQGCVVILTCQVRKCSMKRSEKLAQGDIASTWLSQDSNLCSLSPASVTLYEWFWGSLGNCQKCTLSRPVLDPLHQKLHFHKLIQMALKLRIERGWCGGNGVKKARLYGIVMGSRCQARPEC